MIAFFKRVALRVLILIVAIQSQLRRKRLCVYYLEGIFARKAEAMVQVLREQGLPAELVSGLARNTRVRLLGSADVWIGLWNSVELNQLPARYVLWNAEPVWHSHWQDPGDWTTNLDATRDYRWHDSAARRRDWDRVIAAAQAVWGYSGKDAAVMQKQGKPFTFVPFGYSPYYEQAYGTAKVETQDIDVLFVGWETERRRLMLEKLKHRGFDVVIISQHNSLVGASLDPLLARAKIVLGIHCYDDAEAQVPDFARLDYLLSNRIFTLYERPSASAHDADYEAHVPVCEYEDIPARCAHYLAHPDERAALAERAYQWFKITYPLASFVPGIELRTLLN